LNTTRSRGIEDGGGRRTAKAGVGIMVSILHKILSWVLENKNWLFSGVAIALVGFLTRCVSKRSGSDKTVNKAEAPSAERSSPVKIPPERPLSIWMPRDVDMTELMKYASPEKQAQLRVIIAEANRQKREEAHRINAKKEKSSLSCKIIPVDMIVAGIAAILGWFGKSSNDRR